jgi:hypothetical protein
MRDDYASWLNNFVFEDTKILYTTIHLVGLQHYLSIPNTNTRDRNLGSLPDRKYSSRSIATVID